MEHAVAELDEMVPLAEKALRQVRTLLFDLRPVILETQGVVPALESYAQRLRDAEGLNVMLNTEGEVDRLSHHAEVAIFSVVQEAINNAKKHAHATSIDIDVVSREGDLVVVIRDDGVGFEVEDVAHGYDERGSLGMLNMKERAEIVQGSLSISSEPGGGTTITMQLPIAPNLA
jgi:signal transduction histidine kinase